MLFVKSKFGSCQAECSNDFILRIDNGYGDGQNIGRDFTVGNGMPFAEDLAQFLSHFAALRDGVLAVPR